jgi:hypothetical protein
MAELLFQWTFEIIDWKNFEGTSIAVYAPTYKDALRKVKDLKLPQLLTFEAIEDGVKFIQVYEVDYSVDDIDKEEVTEPEEE